MQPETAFSTRYWKSTSQRIAAGWLRGLALLLLGWSLAAGAADQGISVQSARLELAEDGWNLSADFDIQFTATVQEAVTRGVPLYFIIEFEARTPRWYWWDKRNVVASRERRVTYAPLTQQYRLAVGNYSQSFASFDELKRQLASVRGWTVTGPDSIKLGEKYDIFLRMRLDTARLPKPFQVTAFTTRDWTLASDWQRVNLEAKP